MSDWGEGENPARGCSPQPPPGLHLPPRLAASSTLLILFCFITFKVRPACSVSRLLLSLLWQPREIIPREGAKGKGLWDATGKVRCKISGAEWSGWSGGWRGGYQVKNVRRQGKKSYSLGQKRWSTGKGCRVQGRMLRKKHGVAEVSLPRNTAVWSTKVAAVGRLSLGGGGLKCREKCGRRGWEENRSLKKMGEMEDTTSQAGTEYTENLSLHAFSPRTQ